MDKVRWGIVSKVIGATREEKKKRSVLSRDADDCMMMIMLVM